MISIADLGKRGMKEVGRDGEMRGKGRSGKRRKWEENGEVGRTGRIGREGKSEEGRKISGEKEKVRREGKSHDPRKEWGKDQVKKKSGERKKKFWFSFSDLDQQFSVSPLQEIYKQEKGKRFNLDGKQRLSAFC